MVNRLIGGLCATVLAVGVTAAKAEEVIANHAGMTAVVIGEETCSEVLRIVVRAPDEGLFSGEKPELSVLLKAVRTRLRFECPKAEDVLIEGEVDGRAVYRGAFSEGTGWVLVDLAPPKPGPGNGGKQTGNTEPPVDKTHFMSLTLEGCETKYQSPDFCICAMEQLTKIDLSLAEWELISRDFSNVVELSASNREISTSFRACYR